MIYGEFVIHKLTTTGRAFPDVVLRNVLMCFNIIVLSVCVQVEKIKNLIVFLDYTNTEGCVCCEK